MPPARVVLAEPSRLIRSLLRLALAAPDTVVVAETSSLADVPGLCAVERPDVLLTNCTFDDGELEDVLETVLACGTRVLVVARQAPPERLTALLANGIAGYLVHDTPPESVLEGVLAVARGEAALHPVAASMVLDQWRRLRGDGAAAGVSNDRLTLTPREVEVLAAMADGLSNKAIARRLGVVVKTVENHKTRVFDKLGVRTQAHAVGLAISHGLLSGTTASEPAAAGPTPVGGR